VSVRHADVTDTHADVTDPGSGRRVADVHHADVSSRDAEGSAPLVHPGVETVRLADRNRTLRQSLVAWVHHADIPTHGRPVRDEAITGRPAPVVAAPPGRPAARLSGRPALPYATSTSASTNWLL